MRVERKFLALLVVLCLAVLPGAAQTKAGKPEQAAAKTGAAGKSVRIPIQDYTLKNGLRVVLSEDHSAPTFSICVTYNVGSRDERPGRTGFAHLFEHMMFQGSENVGKGELSLLYQILGGNRNGTTNADRTNYFGTLPANQLDLGLYLEADRMRALAVNQVNLDNQRNVVQEERRLRVDNQPYGKTFETITDLAYENFAYKHSVIGSMADLSAATLDDVKEFFRIYYAPNNAVLTLVGDFDSKAVKAKIEKYFGSIPRQPAPKPPDMTEPEQKEERRKTLEDQFARAARLDMVYKAPPGNTPDADALQVLLQILGSGQSSRLYQKVVREKEAAVALFAGLDERRGPSLGTIVALVRPMKEPAEIEKLIDEEIARVQNEPVADWELEKVRMQFRRQRAQQLHSTLARAVGLGQLAVYYGDPNLVNTVEDKLNKITKEDIQRVARAYLKSTNRSVILTLPKAGAPQPRRGQ